MKSISAAIFLVALVAAQAGFVDYVFNHTSLRGKASLDTKNGLNLGYNGALTYNLSGYNVTILDLGVNFNAAPEKMQIAGNTQNVTVRYSGGVTIGGSVGQSNVTVSGVTAASNTMGSQYDNKTGTTNITFDQAITDSNSVAVRTASSLVTAKTTTGLSAAGVVQQKGNDLRIAENIGFNTASRGSVSANGTSLGAFTATRAINAKVHEHVHITPNATGRKPVADFRGHVGFTDDKYLSFQGSTYNLTSKGGARFGGHAWTKQGNGTTGVALTEGVGYGYRANISVNGTLVARNHGRGGIGIFHGARVNSTSTGSSVHAFQAGKIRQHSRTWLPHKKNSSNRTAPRKFVELLDTEDAFGTEESSLEYFDADENGEFIQIKSPKNLTKGSTTPGCHHKHHHGHHCRNKSIKSFFEAGWKSGTHTTTSLVSNTTVQVDSTNAAVYGAKGWVGNPHKKWHHHGNKTVTASFKQTVGTANLDDIVVRLDESPAFTKKVASIPLPAMPKEPKKSTKPNKPVRKN